MRTPQDRSGAFGPASPPARRGRRLGVALGAAAAALASAGLVYWIGVGEDHSLQAGDAKPAAPPPPAAATYAPARPDAEQVLRAYDQLQEIYAEQGATGVMDFARSCAGSLRADPSVLDFCLAFDTYAAPLEGDDAAARAWQANTEARDLEMARSVLPAGADPAARLAQVRALARQASLDAPTPDASTTAASTGQTAATAATASSGPVPTSRPHAPAPAAKPALARVSGPCRLKATAAQRAVCASPALREADRRLRRAYRRALAAGVGPRRLARDQARFRTAVNAAGGDRAALARLYHRRTRALEGQIRRLQHASPRR